MSKNINYSSASPPSSPVGQPSVRSKVERSFHELEVDNRRRTRLGPHSDAKPSTVLARIHELDDRELDFIPALRVFGVWAVTPQVEPLSPLVNIDRKGA